MEGDLIENIKKIADRIRLTLWSWEPPESRIGMLCGI
jgi:hypothetical protein